MIGSFFFLAPIFVDYYDSWRIQSVFRNGQLLNLKENKKYFCRAQLEEEVKCEIKSNDDEAGRYFLLVGEHGTGKTTLVQHIVQSEKGGIVYVSCPSDPLEFGVAFADAISYSSIYSRSIFRRFFSSLSILPSSSEKNSPMPEYEASQMKFFQAVKLYKKETKRVPILVIDDVNNFSSNPIGVEFLLHLQNLAKVCAVSIILTIIKTL